MASPPAAHAVSPPRAAGLRRGLDHTLGALSGALLLCLVALTCVDVVGRYALNAPLAGAFELTQLGVAALVFCALPLTTERRAHVEVDLVSGLAGPAGRRAMTWVGGVLSALCLAAIAWRIGALGLRQIEDGSVTDALRIPFAPLAFAMAALAALSAGLALFRAAVPNEPAGGAR